jgi:hypothetical protein
MSLIQETLPSRGLASPPGRRTPQFGNLLYRHMFLITIVECFRAIRLSVGIQNIKDRCFCIQCTLCVPIRITINTTPPHFTSHPSRTPPVHCRSKMYRFPRSFPTKIPYNFLVSPPSERDMQPVLASCMSVAVSLLTSEHGHKMPTRTSTVYKYAKEHDPISYEQRGSREHQVENPTLTYQQ